MKDFINQFFEKAALPTANLASERILNYRVGCLSGALVGISDSCYGIGCRLPLTPLSAGIAEVRRRRKAGPLAGTSAALWIKINFQ